MENSSASHGSEVGAGLKKNSEKPLDTDKLYAMNFDLNKENSNGLGLYIVSTLLKNYKIPYEASERDGKFIFCIKLSR